MLAGDSEFQLRGPTVALAKAASAGRLQPVAGAVPSFVQEWRPVRDSNPCYQRERLVSWASRRTGRRAAWVAVAAPRVKAARPVRTAQPAGGGCVGTFGRAGSKQAHGGASLVQMVTTGPRSARSSRAPARM